MAKNDIVEIGTDTMEIMQLEISAGISKKRSRLEMTPALSEFWDKVEKEIKAIKNKGMILDIRPEIPG